MTRVTWPGTGVAHLMPDGGGALCGAALPGDITEAPHWRRLCRRCARVGGLDLVPSADLRELVAEVRRLRERLLVEFSE